MAGFVTGTHTLLCRRLLASLGEKAENRAVHVPVGVLESEPRLGHTEAERGDTIESGRRRRGAHGHATRVRRAHAFTQPVTRRVGYVSKGEKSRAK